MSEMSSGPRLRIAWMEEWMSTLAREVLPDLSLKHDITYVTAGEELPDAEFVRVVRGRLWPTMNLAMVWASIGFALRGVPFINLEGTSVYAEIGLFASRVPFYKRAKFLTGL